MQLQPSEVTSILKKEIEGFQASASTESVGQVIQVGDGVARVYGLDECMMSELLEFPGGVRGIALNLEEDNVGCVLLGDAASVKEGDTVKRTGRIISVPTGPATIGRVVNALGVALDGKGAIQVADEDMRPIEQDAPNVIEREPVSEPMMTGIKALDSMIPVGRGQRELIIGDRQTGKTALIIDAIINQRNSGGGDPSNPDQVICVYNAIGQKQSTVVEVLRRLEESGAMAYTIIVNASASEEASMQFISPYSATAMAERFRDEGRHVLIAYDDLTKQAAAYRQVMLLLRRPPGREAFPGDIFNLHSRLLERSADLARKTCELGARPQFCRPRELERNVDLRDDRPRSAPHHQNPPAEIDRLSDVVRHEDRRAALLFPDSQQFVVELLTEHVVQGRKRLVQQQQIGLRHQRPGERDPHLHAAREHVRAFRGILFVQPHELQAVRDGLMTLGRGRSFQFERQTDIACDRPPGEQRGRLENESRPMRLLSSLEGRDSADAQRTPRRLPQTGQQPQ